jgi:hypothetical protein
MTVLSLFRLFSPMVGGVVAGATVVVLAGNHGRPTRAESLAMAQAPVAAAPVVVSSQNPNLERRLADLEARLARQSSAEAAASAPAHPSTDVVAEREMDTQRELDDHKRLLDRHAAEPRDVAWAANEERDVGAKLHALSATMNGAFSLQSVDCRTSSCVAQLEWPNESVAKTQLKSFLNGSSDVQCARQIAFPPTNGEGPYTASFYLDCAEVRWGGMGARQ